MSDSNGTAKLEGARKIAAFVIGEAADDLCNESEGFDSDFVVRSFSHISAILSLNKQSDISDNAWSCPICFCLPRVPVLLKRCGHVGCRHCLKMNLMKCSDGMFAKCPSCRERYTSLDTFCYELWPVLLKECWKLQRVRCSRKDCVFEGDPLEVAEHERASASCRLGICPSKTCGFEGRFDEVVSHALTCASVFVNCSGCKYPYQLIRHSNHSCERVFRFEREIKEAGIPRGWPTSVAIRNVSADDLVLKLEEAYANAFYEPIETSVAALIDAAQREMFNTQSPPLREVTLSTIASPPPARRQRTDTPSEVIDLTYIDRVETATARTPITSQAASHAPEEGTSRRTRRTLQSGRVLFRRT